MLTILICLSIIGSIYCGTLEEFNTCNAPDSCNLGLKCQSSVCVEDKDAPRCFKKHLEIRRRYARRIIGQSLPQCEENGDFKPVQFSGSKSYCTDKDGEIYIYESPIYDADKKNCKCALKMNDYRKSHLLGKYFRCDKYGNYEKIQCLGSVCFCADGEGQQLRDSVPVDVGLVSTLVCK